MNRSRTFPIHRYGNEGDSPTIEYDPVRRKIGQDAQRAVVLSDKPWKTTPWYTESKNIVYTGESSLTDICWLSADDLSSYFARVPNPYYTLDERKEIVTLYSRYCLQYGLNWLLLFAQNVHETNHMRSWWARPPRRNPAGIGVSGQSTYTPRGSCWAPGGGGIYYRGYSFDSWEASVKTHVACILQYAKAELNETDKLLVQETIHISPRHYGVAPVLNGLNGRWAVPGRTYGSTIAHVANMIKE